jgi:hypothetical protein
MLSFAFSWTDWVIDKSSIPTEMREHLLQYGHDIFERVQWSVFYCPWFIFHLWHGKMIHRRYISKGLILKNNHFDPEHDVSNNGIWLLEWSDHKKSMHKEVKKYFFARNEDDSRWRSLQYFFFFFSFQDRLYMVKNFLPKKISSHRIYLSFVKKISFLWKNLL